MCKYFRFSYDYVLYGISYTNLMMLLSTIPVYKKMDFNKEGKKEEEHVEEVDSLDDFMKLGIE